MTTPSRDEVGQLCDTLRKLGLSPIADVVELLLGRVDDLTAQLAAANERAGAVRVLIKSAKERFTDRDAQCGFMALIQACTILDATTPATENGNE